MASGIKQNHWSAEATCAWAAKPDEWKLISSLKELIEKSEDGQNKDKAIHLLESVKELETKLKRELQGDRHYTGKLRTYQLLRCDPEGMTRLQAWVDSMMMITAWDINLIERHSSIAVYLEYSQSRLQSFLYSIQPELHDSHVVLEYVPALSTLQSKWNKLDFLQKVFNFQEPYTHHIIGELPLEFLLLPVNRVHAQLDIGEMQFIVDIAKRIS